MKRPMILAAVALLLSGWSATADVTAPLREVVDEVCSRNALASSAVGLLAVTADGDPTSASRRGWATPENCAAECCTATST